jgi:hypothetical protein
MGRTERTLDIPECRTTQSQVSRPFSRVPRSIRPQKLGCRPETKRLEDPWGIDLVSLIERMWHHDPVERPTMNDVVDDLVAIIEMKKKHR